MHFLTNRTSGLRRSLWYFFYYVGCFIFTIFIYEVCLREATYGRFVTSEIHPSSSRSSNHIGVARESLDIAGTTPSVRETELRVPEVPLQSRTVTEKIPQGKENAERKYKINGDLVGFIWPKLGSLDDRIINQMRYMKEYAAIRGDNFTRNKIILRVGDFNFDDLHWKNGQERLIEDKCPIKNCIYSSDRSQAKVADALLISQFGGGQLQFYTPKPAHQIWITQHLESPHHNRMDPGSLSNLVNWTVSFRQESTIALPYAAWELRNTSDQSLSEVNYAKGKTKKVAWFVSNCADRNGRLHYANELKKYIDVDIYGACGTLSCPIVRGNVNCYAMLKKDYKFYLGFENSNCVGYITEKIHWNGLANDVIPIVMGARPEDYASAAPPGSYIHVDDFESPLHLAKHLRVLDGNDTLYNEYFKYKKQWKIVDIHDTFYWCRLCALVHLKEDVNYVHWYEDYNKWWNGACYSRQDGANPWWTWRPQGYWNNGSRAFNVKDCVDKPS